MLSLYRGIWDRADIAERIRGKFETKYFNNGLTRVGSWFAQNENCWIEKKIFGGVHSPNFVTKFEENEKVSL